MLIEPKTILTQYWGYNDFRPGQEEIIRAVLNGRDSLALLPTGAGKSLCYQVPALVNEGMVLVISPLVALMKDQVAGLMARNIPALAVYSGMSKRALDLELDKAVFGRYKVLYCSPERLKTDLFETRLEKMDVRLIAVDEAHCISEWGYDFRPAYLNLAAVRALKPDVPLLALTASATPEVAEDIIAKLELKEPVVVRNSFVRPNLSWIVRRSPRKEDRLLQAFQKVKGSGLVYVRSRRKARELGILLQQHGFSASWYHAGLSPEERAMRQQQWMEDKISIMACTTAFGMGIDKPDVRAVIHMDLPESLEAYYQESGRAGRDGKPCWAGLFYDETDREAVLANAKDEIPEAEFIRSVYDLLASHFQLAYGAGEGMSFNFELSPFCKQHGTELRKTWKSIKVLQDEGWLVVSEYVRIPARAMIRTNRESLYRFQVEHKKSDKLIKAILRTSPGIFDHYAALDERRLGTMMQWTASEVRKGLEDLDRYGIIDFDKARNSPQLVWLKPRYEAGKSSKLPLDLKMLEWRRKRHIARIEAVLNYVSQEDTCRSILLTSYFGETDTAPCGICDSCQKDSRSQNAEKQFEELLRRIELELKRHPKSPAELSDCMPQVGADELGKAVSWLTDRGKVIRDAENRLTWRP